MMRSPLTTLALVLCLLLIATSAPAGAVDRPELLLAQVYGWDQGRDPAQYWVSEKYDGVRAVWDGTRLRFRSGREIAAPAWFTDGLPAKVALDGELWLGRGTFQRLLGIVRKEVPVEAEWRQVRLMVFELPGAEGTFTERIALIKELIDQARLPWLQAAPQFRVADEQALKRRLSEVVAAGGEGLMLHRAAARYHGGRGADLLKLKMWLDAEAEVVGYLPGSGKYQGMMGSMEVKRADGCRFLIGSGFSAADRREPPPKGTTITYRYTGLTKGGLPRFPAFLRVRQEL
jgi:DNA ligase-1